MLCGDYKWNVDARSPAVYALAGVNDFAELMRARIGEQTDLR